MAKVLNLKKIDGLNHRRWSRSKDHLALIKQHSLKLATSTEVDLRDHYQIVNERPRLTMTIDRQRDSEILEDSILLSTASKK